MTQENIVEHELVSEVTTENKLAKHAIQVHKFGGSSLATPKCIKRVLEIIRENCQLNDIVVVSANGKTTDSLFTIYSLVEKNIAEQALPTSNNLTQAITELAKEQAQLITELLNDNNTQQLLLGLNKDIEQLTTWLADDIIQHRNDILAFGEVWSARLLSALLNEQVCPSNCIDSRDFLVIDNEQSCTVDTAISAAQLRQRRQFGKLAVITGYISK
ncbi:MAG: aspartokinase/homoserine dehydrogenase 2, partial [Colwellia sp.]